MKNKMSLATRCIVSVLILNFLCFFIQMSFTLIAVGIGTTPLGHDVYVEENGEQVRQYTHYYADGEDKLLEQWEKEGKEYSVVEFRSDLSKSTSFFLRALTMVFSLSIFIAMIYSALWKQGDSDNNLTVYGGEKRDLFKGLKVGLIATVPFAALYLLLVINKFVTFFPGIYGVFKMANYYIFPLIDFAYGAADSVSQISLGGLLILLLTLVPVPLAAALGYYCGNKEISIKNKLIYVKEKK